MDEEDERQKTTVPSLRERVAKLLGIRSGRVLAAEDDVESAETSKTVADNSRRRGSESTLDVPIMYVPQFDTRELRVNNEECTCPRVNSEPTFIARPLDAPLRVPPSNSAVSGRSVRSAISQVIPNAENKFRTLFTVWDTRLSMKLFGSQNGIRKEEERRKSCKHWIIHPCSKFRYERNNNNTK